MAVTLASISGGMRKYSGGTAGASLSQANLPAFKMFGSISSGLENILTKFTEASNSTNSSLSKSLEFAKNQEDISKDILGQLIKLNESNEKILTALTPSLDDLEALREFKKAGGGAAGAAAGSGLANTPTDNKESKSFLENLLAGPLDELLVGGLIGSKLKDLMGKGAAVAGGAGAASYASKAMGIMKFALGRALGGWLIASAGDFAGDLVTDLTGNEKLGDYIDTSTMAAGLGFTLAGPIGALVAAAGTLAVQVLDDARLKALEDYRKEGAADLNKETAANVSMEPSADGMKKTWSEVVSSITDPNDQIIALQNAAAAAAAARRDFLDKEALDWNEQQTADFEANVQALKSLSEKDPRFKPVYESIIGSGLAVGQSSQMQSPMNFDRTPYEAAIKGMAGKPLSSGASGNFTMPDLGVWETPETPRGPTALELFKQGVANGEADNWQEYLKLYRSVARKGSDTSGDKNIDAQILSGTVELKVREKFNGELPGYGTEEWGKTLKETFLSNSPPTKAIIDDGPIGNLPAGDNHGSEVTVLNPTPDGTGYVVKLPDGSLTTIGKEVLKFNKAPGDSSLNNMSLGDQESSLLSKSERSMGFIPNEAPILTAEASGGSYNPDTVYAGIKPRTKRQAEIILWNQENGTYKYNPEVIEAAEKLAKRKLKAPIVAPIPLPRLDRNKNKREAGNFTMPDLGVWETPTAGPDPVEAAKAKAEEARKIAADLQLQIDAGAASIAAKQRAADLAKFRRADAASIAALPPIPVLSGNPINAMGIPIPDLVDKPLPNFDWGTYVERIEDKGSFVPSPEELLDLQRNPLGNGYTPRPEISPDLTWWGGGGTGSEWKGIFDEAAEAISAKKVDELYSGIYAAPVRPDATSYIQSQGAPGNQPIVITVPSSNQSQPIMPPSISSDGGGSNDPGPTYDMLFPWRPTWFKGFF